MRLWRKGSRRKGSDIVRSLPPITSEQARLIFRLGRLYEPGVPIAPRQMFSSDINTMRSLPVLTDEQWRLVYDTEEYVSDILAKKDARPTEEQLKEYAAVLAHINKSKAKVPLLSPEAKLKLALCVAVYLVGCLLLYCGVLNTVGHLYTHHELRFLPDTDLPNSFAKAANSVLDGAAILPNSFTEAANSILDGVAILILRPFVAAWMAGVGLVVILFTPYCIILAARHYATTFLGWLRERRT